MKHKNDKESKKPNDTGIGTVLGQDLVDAAGTCGQRARSTSALSGGVAGADPVEWSFIAPDPRLS